MSRSLPAIFALCLCAGCRAPLAAQPPAAPVAPSTYESPAGLRADVAALGPDPFRWAPATPGTGAPPAPKRPDTPVPANVAHLALIRPYVLAVAPGETAPAGFVPVLPPPEKAPVPAGLFRLEALPANPFLPPEPAPAFPAVAKEAAADWYQPWLFAPHGLAWEALEAAWARDPIAVRRAFREETKQDWPVTAAAGPRAEASCLAAARWVQHRWESALRARIASGKQSLGLRGPSLVEGAPDADLSALALGDTAAPALTIAPRVTNDPMVNRYGVGFLVRLSADLSERIPWPALDLSGLAPADVPWAALWLDDVVRNGVQGIILTPPHDPAAAASVEAALRPLSVPNVYLPPPSEVGILVSRDTAALEPGAWVATFRAYAALRAAGVWPDFVSDEQALSGRVPLARFDALVVPAARWADRDLLDAVRAWTERGGTLAVTDPFAFSRARDGFDTAPRARDLFGWAAAEPRDSEEAGPVRVTPAPGTRALASAPDGAPLLTDRVLGYGRVLASVLPLDAPGPEADLLVRAMLRSAKIPPRPWLESVTISNVKRITGTYRRPAPGS